MSEGDENPAAKRARFMTDIDKFSQKVIIVENVPRNCTWLHLKRCFNKNTNMRLKAFMAMVEEPNQTTNTCLMKFQDDSQCIQAYHTLRNSLWKLEDNILKISLHTSGMLTNKYRLPTGIYYFGEDKQEENVLQQHIDKVVEKSKQSLKHKVDERQNMGGTNVIIDNEESDYNTYGLSKSFLDLLNINLPLTNRIFVLGLSPDVTLKQIKTIFKLAGTIVSIMIFKNPGTGKSKGVVKIVYDHPVEAVQAISMFDSQEIFERQVRVRMDLQPSKKEKLPLPPGLRAIGLGLGPNGAPLRNIPLHCEKASLSQEKNKNNDQVQDTKTNEPNNQNAWGTDLNRPPPFTYPDQMNLNLPVYPLNAPAMPNVLNPVSQWDTSNSTNSMMQNANMMQNPSNHFIPNSMMTNTANPMMQNTGNPMMANTAMQNTANPMIANTAMQNTGNPIMANTAMQNTGNPIMANTAMQNTANAFMQNANSMMTPGNMMANPLNQLQNTVNPAQNQQAILLQAFQALQGGSNSNNNLAATLAALTNPGLGGNALALALMGGLNQNQTATQQNVQDVQEPKKQDPPIFISAGNSEVKAQEEHIDRQTHKQKVQNSDMVSVNYLPLHVTCAILREKFSEAGEVKFAEMTRPGSAIVRFKNQWDADRAVKMFDRIRVDGNPIEVKFFY